MAKFRALLLVYFVAIVSVLIPTNAANLLTPDFYEQICPQALPAIRNVVLEAIKCEPRMGASLLRLHFHDCFVNGCDGSILLDDMANFVGEKTGLPNLNSVRGFDVVDKIKSAVNTACKANVVSCADILAIAARDSVSILGGPYYKVQLGRRDSKTANLTAANTNLPPAFFNFSQLLSAYQAHGLDLKDLVALSGGHTIGLARCTTFRDRAYNDTIIDFKFAAELRKTCPRIGGDNNTEPLDGTTRIFDNQYFKDLINFKGLLHSDQELYKGDGSPSDQLVKKYSINPEQFAQDFVRSMIKMGNIKPLIGDEGEIRFNCRKVNNYY